ncbi:hypothetical protein QOT17_001101 [Balamuthia mandrillaris]
MEDLTNKNLGQKRIEIEELGQLLLLLALALLLGVHVRQGNCGAITDALVSPAVVPGQTFTLSYTICPAVQSSFLQSISNATAPHAFITNLCQREPQLLVTSRQSYSLPAEFKPLQGPEVLVTLHETTLAPAVELAVNAAPQFSLATTFSSFPSSITPGAILSFNVELLNDTKRGGPAALRAESSSASEGGTDLKFGV